MAAGAGDGHIVCYRGQLQVPVQWQKLVADIHMGGSGEAGSIGWGICRGSGSGCALLWLHNCPLHLCLQGRLMTGIDPGAYRCIIGGASCRKHSGEARTKDRA